MNWISEKDDGVVIRVKVQPKASRTKHQNAGDYLKIWVTSPPVDGKANEAVVEYLSKILKVSKSRISLVSGEKSRDKNISIEGVTKDEIKEKLGC
ncbi:conserved hypothetical protein [Thermosulfidibacter takaii ABI70S6]|uniref:UPF0235 protein TST_0479 n=1 Tax=Thermosulfidibacter takaii (strain DSM 17441 / JCM 13301 / NBRC 103674 / ABI70S6) TaxID=1298851 RepID=A0A0S3QSH2_THET7|nr:DUF167 domain-containing protein [Thermosulfidibacter takaii]BAT71286.1 conserved hypothetical protein [Thermosulfidibacter takaii ABI70S6]